METEVSEIHRHPLRPPGFAEPLFLGHEHKKEIAEHLAGSPWLQKASDAVGGRPGGARRCHVLSREDGRVFLVNGEGRGCRRRVRKRRVGRVLERWREVSGWWESEGGAAVVDRLCFRLALRGGAVVDVAFDRRRDGWLLLGVLD